MTTNVVKLTRLSRNKTAGNVLIILLIFLFCSLFLTYFSPNFINSAERLFGLASSFFCIILIIAVHKNFRKPFFSAISHYIGELNDRHFDTQQFAVEIDSIEPIQTISALGSVINQVNELQGEVKNILDQSSNEISTNFPPIRTPQIQNKLRTVIKLAEDSLDEIAKKRENILFLAKSRRIILKTINNQISRPRNEIETDYLLFKVQKSVDQFVDDVLIDRIINHALEKGEIKGRLIEDENGEKVLAVDQIIKSELMANIPLSDSSHEREYCVICRRGIQISEASSICPFCENVFHRSHLLEWLKVFNQCPICQHRITLFSNSY